MKIWPIIKAQKNILGIGLLALIIFLLTWHGFFTGYEKETWESAEAWMSGSYTVRRGGPVAVLMYLPFVFLARIIPALHTERFFTLVPVIYSAVQVMVLYVIAKKIGVAEKTAGIWALLTTLACGVWVYANAGMEYQAGLWISVLVLTFLNWQEKKGLAWLPSLAMAGVLGTKAYMVALGLPYLIFFAVTFYNRGERRKFWSIKFLISAGLIPGLFLALNLLINWYLYGRLSGSYRAGGEFQIWEWWEGFYGIFFSASKNIFLYAPLLIPTFWLWPKFYQEQKSLAWFVIASTILLGVINLPFSYWTDETWGVRKFIPILPLLHLPLLFLVRDWTQKNRFKKVVIIGLLTMALYINFLGAAYTYSRQLFLARQAGIDSLTTMRYLPQWSHPVLFHQLFSSYLSQLVSGQDKVKTYHESTWMRWLEPGNYDIIVRNVRLPLGEYDEPSIFWIHYFFNNN